MYMRDRGRGGCAGLRSHLKRRAVSGIGATRLASQAASATMRLMRAIHPGEVLREEFLVPMGSRAHALAMALHVPAPCIDDVVRERRAISADTAVRLARCFGTGAAFWMGLQADYEMALARKALAAELRSITPRRDAVAA